MTLEELAEAFPEAEGENLAMALDLLRPFDNLMPVRCGDHLLRLPDRNNLWRGLQFWGLVTGRLTIDFTRFCLAGNCEQCTTKIVRSGGAPEVVLACRTEPEPGLEIHELAEGFRLHP